MQNEVMRERMFTMRLSEDEGRRLDGLADHYGLNAVGVIRMLLKREADSIPGLKSPRPTNPESIPTKTKPKK